MPTKPWSSAHRRLGGLAAVAALVLIGCGAGPEAAPKAASQSDPAADSADERASGQQLRPVNHLDTFWFAWAAGEPSTTIVDPKD